MKLSLTLTLTLLVSCCLADDKISPVTVFKVGKTYHQTMTMVQDVTTPAGAMQTTMVTELSMKVTAGPTKDSKHIKTTYEAMKIKSGMGDKSNAEFRLCGQGG